MATENYNFTEIDGTSQINLVEDINVPLNEIDAAIYNERSDAIDRESVIIEYANDTFIDSNYSR